MYLTDKAIFEDLGYDRIDYKDKLQKGKVYIK